jgi:zona occludens toxin (predicted ATPase)
MNLQTLKDGLRLAEDDIKSVWEKDKVLIALIIIPLILLKIKSMIVDQLTNLSKKDLASTVAQTEVLAAQETKADAQADAIVKKADEDRKQEQGQSVQDDWFKK